MVLIAILCLIWGSTWLVIREGLRDLPPFTSAAVRFLLAGAIMAALAPRLGRLEGGRPPSLALVVVMALGNFSISYGIVYWCETILPSGLVSVLWSVFPILLAVFGHFLLPGERLVGRQWLGLVGGFLGVALLFATDLRAIGSEAIPAGLLLLASPAISAIGTCYVKRHAAHTRSVLLNRNGMLLGGLLLLALALVLERDEHASWTVAAVSSVLYLTLFGTVTTFGLYFWLLRSAPATQLSLIAYIIPVIALTLGAAVRSEPIGLNTLSGTAIILLGVATVLTGGRSKSRSETWAESKRGDSC